MMQKEEIPEQRFEKPLEGGGRRKKKRPKLPFFLFPYLNGGRDLSES
jgi:hypothetical protein